MNFFVLPGQAGVGGGHAPARANRCPGHRRERCVAGIRDRDQGGPYQGLGPPQAQDREADGCRHEAIKMIARNAGARSRGACYAMTVKANMPTLYKQLKKLPGAVPSVSAVSTDHGRRARRTIKAVLAPAYGLRATPALEPTSRAPGWGPPPGTWRHAAAGPRPAAPTQARRRRGDRSHGTPRRDAHPAGLHDAEHDIRLFPAAVLGTAARGGDVAPDGSASTSVPRRPVPGRPQAAGSERRPRGSTRSAG